ncbi:putative oxidoreductase C1F5.03c [Paramyrothecium foliicola]|nr:putative oxidoreductase C1F5.03c [Paramyrothecium foliicola]
MPSCERAARTTLCDWLSRYCTTAAPMPLLAPETMKTFEVAMIACLLFVDWIGLAETCNGVIPVASDSIRLIILINATMATTVIVGSGIIGLSTAYYLTEHQPGSSIHLVDSSAELFASASGYAGGFLAEDWHQGATAALGRLSYAEHARLAAANDGGERWGYSRTITVAYDPGRRAGSQGGERIQDGTSRATSAGTKGTRQESDEKVPSWLRRVDGDSLTLMDDGSGTAIVDPLKLCQFLLEKVKAAGVHVYHPATALSIERDVRGELASVRIGYTDSSTEVEIPATRLLLSAGCWTPQVFSTLFGRSAAAHIPVASLAGHSLVVRNPSGATAGEPCHAVYCSFETLSPELYSRPGGIIYIAGVNSSAIPLPELATGAQPVDEPLEELKQLARRVILTPSGDGGELEVVRAGLCFRPVTPRGVPILARIPDEQLGHGMATRPGAEGGVFVAVGHGPWGISLSLGTGLVMADLMQGREPSVDISGLEL